MVAHAFNPRTREAEAGKASLGYKDSNNKSLQASVIALEEFFSNKIRSARRGPDKVISILDKRNQCPEPTVPLLGPGTTAWGHLLGA